MGSFLPPLQGREKVDRDNWNVHHDGKVIGTIKREARRFTIRALGPDGRVFVSTCSGYSTLRVAEDAIRTINRGGATPIAPPGTIVYSDGQRVTGKVPS